MAKRKSNVAKCKVWTESPRPRPPATSPCMHALPPGMPSSTAYRNAGAVPTPSAGSTPDMLSSLKWWLNAIADGCSARGFWRVANCIDGLALAIHRRQARLFPPP